MKKYYNNKSFKVLLSILLMLMPLWSCKKFVTLPLPSSQIPANAIFNDVSGINAALNGAYSNVAGYVSPDIYIKTSMFADELISKSSTDDISQKNQYKATDDYGYFSFYFQSIYWVNIIIGGIDNATNIPIATRNQVKGECLFLRAFSYFNLVNLYGNVPLYTGSDVNSNSLLPASAPADVYKQIFADLNNALPLLSNDYAAGTRTRANKQTVNALLARAYLYTKDYVNANVTATAVINSQVYSMNTDLNTVFQTNSNETIWQLYNQNDYVFTSFIPSNPATSFNYTVRSGLASSFELGDARKTSWLQAGTGAQATNYYPNKWKASYNTAGAAPEYLIEFRLAEMYLIRAEALAKTNDVSNGLKDVYVVRNRAGLLAPLVGVTTSDQLLDVIASERRKELCFEGQRWFDLIRTGTAVSLLAPLKPGFDAHLTILPIPLNNVLKFNPNLKQNPGYN